MWSRIRDWWRPALALDMGTANTRIARGDAAANGPAAVLVSEPSVVACSDGTGQVLGRGTAVGKIARQMIGRTPETIRAERPIRGGAVADFDLARAMLAHLLTKVTRRHFRSRPHVVLATPSDLSAVERQAALHVVERAGAGSVLTVTSAQAAAIGAGLPLSEPQASLICDIGAGVTDIGLFSVGEEVACRSVSCAGDMFDAAIARHLREQFSLDIDPRVAEEVKLRIGSASPLPEERMIEVGGRDVIGGVPRKASVTTEEVREALAGPLDDLLRALTDVVERTPTGLVSDLAHTGLTLAGGSARLPGLARWFEHRLGIPVRIADRPEECVVRGLAICLDHLSLWRPALLARRKAG